MLLFAGLMRRLAPPIAIRSPPPYIRGCRSAISRSKNGSLLSRAWRSRLDPCRNAGLGRWSREMKTKVASTLFVLAATGCAQEPPQPAQSAAPPTTTFAAVQPAPGPALAPSDAQIAPGPWSVERVRCSGLLGASTRTAPRRRCSITGIWPPRRASISSTSANRRQCQQGDESVRGLTRPHRAASFSAGAPITLSILLASLVPRFSPW